MNGEPIDVLDSDGVPIKVGDTVWHIGHDGRYTVEAPTAPEGYVSIKLMNCDTGVMGWYDPQRLTHRERYTQEADAHEKINADALKCTDDYWECFNESCSKCPSKVDGKTPAERYGVKGCSAAMRLDLLRRQRDLCLREARDAE
ncbi:hypothetical protein [Adlercreutzia sp. ZJ242]|uniref:hypothetical protein n=1 Tax=Adlercreutzia sp. ZJ242 TaxID=2709409 RepID=UPI0013EDD899|nr:hypothetical protein [Adlercreutzia sp. ZJ242]